ncbi:MAG: hypothetical protein AAFO79_10630 [Pseudomonadota bacterium]
MSHSAALFSPVSIRTRLFMGTAAHGSTLAAIKVCPVPEQGAVSRPVLPRLDRVWEKLANVVCTGVVAAALALMVAHVSPAAAQDVNDMINGSETAATGAATTPGAPATTPGATRTPAQPDSGDATQLKGEKAWIKHALSIAHLDIITARPLADQACRDVIFNAAVPVKTRLSVAAAGTLPVPLDGLCMVSLRNNAADRTLVVRMAEAFETLSIAPHPQLFTGMELAPGQQITVPIRPLSVAALTVGVETVWKADLNTANPKVDSAVLKFTGK